MAGNIWPWELVSCDFINGEAIHTVEGVFPDRATALWAGADRLIALQFDFEYPGCCQELIDTGKFRTPDYIVEENSYALFVQEHV